MMINYTPESLKKKSVMVREFLKEKYGINVSHSHGLELISKVFGFKDWNTTLADLKQNTKQDLPSTEIRTVGDMKKILECCDDSWTIDADYEFKLNEFEIDSLSHLDDEIHQEFFLSFKEVNENIVTLKLHLEHESASSCCTP